LKDKADKLGNELSKGMMQKVSICCALIIKPQVILLDEPMVGLDPAAIKELKQMIMELKANQVTVLISTHMLDMVKDLWDIMFVMDKGHVIATSACLGGELSYYTLLMSKARALEDKESERLYYDKINNFIQYCLDVFGQDFYIECAPSAHSDQVTVNKILIKIANTYQIPMTVGSDAHYLEKKDRWIHKSYLNSKGGEREVDSFYEYAHLFSEEECKEVLAKSFEETNLEVSIIDGFKEEISYYMSEYDSYKAVVFFIGLIKCFKTKVQESELSEIFLTTFEDAYNQISFEDTKLLLKKAQNFLIKNS
jgi:ABC-type multidrug transport system ATPase subunit